ncbi:K7_Ymr002wp [Saccharomyces cerevisiae Kyokai no. 7]|uniref:K7_Ymr002wp n=1 Tax=Saccharomyces cerevisiae (strain Kyokai no. 7 / NBRC 101557) TaxID=721032 RepID=G2WK54_YEASK|nr:K7_Ymr002wp [Saccharomyces cerevisiae Kyokai no. 7]
MARSRGSSRPISRSRPTQTRSASTMAAPVHPQQQQQPNAYSHPPAAGAQTRQPGMFAQMASTAAGITGMFSGSGSDSAPVEQQQQNMANTSGQTQTDQQLGRTCEIDARNFTRCLDENNGNFQICDYYLQQLKACQEAARQY